MCLSDKQIHWMERGLLCGFCFFYHSLYHFLPNGVHCGVVDVGRGFDVPVTVRKRAGYISLLARLLMKPWLEVPILELPVQDLPALELPWLEIPTSELAWQSLRG